MSDKGGNDAGIVETLKRMKSDGMVGIFQEHVDFGDRNESLNASVLNSLIIGDGRQIDESLGAS